MIILRITSGLGNQMYQYAFYTLLKERYKDTEVLCDTTWFNSFHEHHGYELEKIFGNVNGSLFEIKKAPVGKIISLSGRIPNFFSGSFSNTFEKIRRYPNRLLKNNLLKKRLPYIIDEHEGDIPSTDVINPDGTVTNELFDKVMNLDMSKDYYIKGFFISEKYYGQVIDTVRQKLVFPEFAEEHNMEYEKAIRCSDSVSIHVRRGDYLSDLYKDKFLTLGKEYYESAVNYITEEIKLRCKKENRTPDIRFFVFSDDVDFVNKEFDWLEGKTIVTGNSGEMSFRDMQLMSICRYNITANSTFSQWGALLNCNPSHLTIYPKAYMSDSDNEIKSDKTWVMI